MRLFALRAYSHAPGGSTSLPTFEDAALLTAVSGSLSCASWSISSGGTTEVESTPGTGSIPGVHLPAIGTQSAKIAA